YAARALCALGLGAAVTLACGGGKKQPMPPGPGPGSNETSKLDPTPPAKPDQHPAVIPEPPVADSPPELFPPPWKKVGVGQTVSFSVAAIDQNLDETRVEVTDMPKSATFDAITQTVTWTPTKADVPRVQFQLRVSQE